MRDGGCSREFGRVCLAAKWGPCFAEMIGSLMAGVWQPGNYLAGLAKPYNLVKVRLALVAIFLNLSNHCRLSV